MRCGYYEIKSEALLSKDFTPAFSLNNLTKDVGFMNKEAQAQGLHLPITEAVQYLLEKTLSLGIGEKDVSAVYLALEPKVTTSKNERKRF
jgi:3-hydroxyisobutyrate dehydrogenase